MLRFPALKAFRDEGTVPQFPKNACNLLPLTYWGLLMQICEQVNADECAYYILDKIKANKNRDLLDWITNEEMGYSRQCINEVYCEIYTERLIDGTIFVHALDIQIVVNDSLAFVELLRMWAENYLKQNPKKSLFRIDSTADMQAIEKVKREMKRVNIARTS